MSSTSNKSTRAAIYARVSTHEQDTGMQVAELRQVCGQRGWNIVAEHLDDGVSGVATARAGLDALLADVQAGKLDVVVVWKLDRLGRSLSHVLGLLDGFTASGVQFVSVRDPGIDSTSITGRLLTQVLACFAAYERDMIRMRVQAGVDRARANGIHCGRPRVELDLRPAVAMLNEGYGVKAISKALGVSRTTLRRRLRERGGHNPTVAEAA